MNEERKTFERFDRDDTSLFDQDLAKAVGYCLYTYGEKITSNLINS